MLDMTSFILDDFADAEQARFGTQWIHFTDQVMGGLSEGQSEVTLKDDRSCLHLSGAVSLDNMGGFVQVALPLVHSRYLFDARHFQGVSLLCQSPEPEGYYVHLRTRELSMPWQHYRATFFPGRSWTQCQIPFEAFIPSGTGHPLNLSRLTRLGIVAGRKVFQPELYLAEVGFY